jgi:hypothetical protein
VDEENIRRLRRFSQIPFSGSAETAQDPLRQQAADVPVISGYN